MSRPSWTYYVDISGHSPRPQTDYFHFPTAFLDTLSLDPDAWLSDARAETCLVRHSRFLELTVTLTVEGEMSCSRCLKKLPLKLEKKELYIVKFWTETEPESDDPYLLWIHKNDVRLDLSRIFSEMLMEVLPARFTCREEDNPKPCDFQMLNKLREISVSH